MTKSKTDDEILNQLIKKYAIVLGYIFNTSDVLKITSEAITLAKEAKAEEIRINVMKDIKSWMYGRPKDIMFIKKILVKHTK